MIYFLSLFVLIILIGVFYLSSRSLRIRRENSQMLERLINGRFTCPFLGLWFYCLVQGNYKNKDIICKMNLLTGGITGAGPNPPYLYSPVKNNEKKYWNRVWITESTYYWGGNIHFAVNPNPVKRPFYNTALGFFYSKIFTEAEMQQILDELIEAVDIFNADPSKYQK